MHNTDAANIKETAQNTPTSKPKNVQMSELEIVLADSKPRIWRRLLVRGDMTLGLLHAVIQVAMGWTNSHLHQFLVGREVFSDPTLNADRDFADGPPDLDERKVTVQEVTRREHARFIYDYDFGDSWHHLVTVQRIGYANPEEIPFAMCLDGERACPPEDCGGVWGYEKLLKIVKNRRHEEHASMMEWLGGKFDPAAFDCDRVNQSLRQLRWPRTTIPQLGRVLAAAGNARTA